MKSNAGQKWNDKQGMYPGLKKNLHLWSGEEGYNCQGIKTPFRITKRRIIKLRLSRVELLWLKLPTTRLPMVIHPIVGLHWKKITRGNITQGKKPWVKSPSKITHGIIPHCLHWQWLPRVKSISMLLYPSVKLHFERLPRVKSLSMILHDIIPKCWTTLWKITQGHITQGKIS